MAPMVVDTVSSNTAITPIEGALSIIVINHFFMAPFYYSCMSIALCSNIYYIGERVVLAYNTKVLYYANNSATLSLASSRLVA